MLSVFSLLCCVVPYVQSLYLCAFGSILCMFTYQSQYKSSGRKCSWTGLARCGLSDTLRKKRDEVTRGRNVKRKLHVRAQLLSVILVLVNSCTTGETMG